jgi:hypothetical protein
MQGTATLKPRCATSIPTRKTFLDIVTVQRKKVSVVTTVFTAAQTGIAKDTLRRALEDTTKIPLRQLQPTRPAD